MGPEDTPAEVFKECIFDSFVENPQTTSKVLDSTLDLRTIRHGEWCRKGLTFAHGMDLF